VDVQPFSLPKGSQKKKKATPKYFYKKSKNPTSLALVLSPVEAEHDNNGWVVVREREREEAGRQATAFLAAAQSNP
jgi:hypothetical protein